MISQRAELNERVYEEKDQMYICLFQLVPVNKNRLLFLNIYFDYR